jgi:protein phosphatase
MKSMLIEAASRTDRGLVREGNEDAVATFPEYGLVVLADGMGGHCSGEVASQLAVETIGTLMLMSEGDVVLRSVVEAANTAIIQAIEDSPEYEGMGTTLAMAMFKSRRIHFAHVGDSRIYRFRSGRLEQLTRDHSIIQELVDQGLFESAEEARGAGVKNNIITRGLGITREVDVEEGVDDVQTEDIYLICSDGLSDMVPDPVIEETLGKGGEGLSDLCGKLLDLAIRNGGSDNVSLILVRPGA